MTPTLDESNIPACPPNPEIIKTTFDRHSASPVPQIRRLEPPAGNATLLAPASVTQTKYKHTQFRTLGLKIDT
ncbi:hypothetical protein N9267_00940, partial [bacterium]|nr:hypothetical protein [bacterium]